MCSPRTSSGRRDCCLPSSGSLAASLAWLAGSYSGGNLGASRQPGAPRGLGWEEVGLVGSLLL